MNKLKLFEKAYKYLIINKFKWKSFHFNTRVLNNSKKESTEKVAHFKFPTKISGFHRQVLVEGDERTYPKGAHHVYCVIIILKLSMLKLI